MLNNKNYLSQNVYLIDRDLHEYLDKGMSFRFGDNSMIKGVSGTYLVVIRLLNKDSNVLIYNYVFYPYLLDRSLTYFLLQKRDYQNSLLYTEWGDYLTLVGTNKLVEDKFYCNMNNECLGSFLNIGYTTDITINSYSELFIYINKLIYYGDYDLLVKLVDLAVKRNFKEFVNEVLNVEDFYKIYNRRLSLEIDENVNEKLNILNGCMFVIQEDLELFIEKLRNRGYVVNTGPQKWRGQINSMNNFLTCIDVDFRHSLYRHNQFHVNNSDIGSKYSLNKSKFSYRNIHQNLGGVRWYSSRVTSRPPVRVKSISENSAIYSYLYQWLGKSPINEETQLELENYLLNQTYIDFDKESASKKKPIIDYTMFSNKLLKLLLEKKLIMIKLINNFKSVPHILKETKRRNQKQETRYYLNILLKEINNDDVISIIFGRLMRVITLHNRLYSNEGMIDIFHDLCDNLVRNYWFILYNKELKRLCLEKNLEYNNDKELEKQIKNMMINYTLSDWKRDNLSLVNMFDDPTLMSNMGGVIIDWMMESGLVEIQTVVVENKKKASVLIPTRIVLDSIGDNNNKLSHLPFRLPMIVKPKPYYRESVNGVIVEKLGGYLLNDIKTSDSIQIQNWELKCPSMITDINVVYNMVNNISSIGYKVNKDVLDFIYKYAVEYDLIIYKDHPFSSRSYKGLRRFEKIELESYINKRELQENILGLAKVFSQVHEFYLPVRIDFRSRMYCVSEFLNYQSTELAKALLLFSRGEKVSKSNIIAINYLKAFGANCYGNKLDKKSWNDRIKWIDDNINDIVNFENGKLISKAKNKLLFIAFCFEYNKYIKSLDNQESSYFITHLPIQMDATCNGYQHLSLLSLDLSLAKELNLTTSTWSDVPKDFYNYLSTNLIDIFRDKLKNDKLSKEDRMDYSRLCNLSLARTIIKKSVMTIPYNVSLVQMIKYIREHFEFCSDNINKDFQEQLFRLKDVDDEDKILLKYKDFTKIATGLKEILSNNFFKLKLLMNYLRNVAKICTWLELPITWGTPNGLLVDQSYLGTNEVPLTPFSYNKNKFSMKVPNKEKYNGPKQIRAFMPNLIHSLDATSLALLVDYFYNNNNNGKSIYAVHDCYAVTANNVENIMALLKLVYIKIYSDGTYLRKFDQEIKNRIKFHYGEDSLNEKNLSLYIHNKKDYSKKEESKDKNKKDKDNKIFFPDIEEVLNNKLPTLDINKELKQSSYIAN